MVMAEKLSKKNRVSACNILNNREGLNQNLEHVVDLALYIGNAFTSESSKL